LVRESGVREVHLSASRRTPARGGFGMNTIPNPARVLGVLEALDQAFGKRAS
jgi:hypothetical protein